MGTIDNIVPPITDWYNLTLPVAAEETINGFATESTNVIQSMILKNVTVQSGTVFNHNVKSGLASKKTGSEINSSKKKVYLELL